MRFIVAFILILLANPAWAVAVKVCPPPGTATCGDGSTADFTSLGTALAANTTVPKTITISGSWTAPDSATASNIGYSPTSANPLIITATGTSRNDGTATKSGQYKLTGAFNLYATATTADAVIIDGLCIETTIHAVNYGDTGGTFKNNVIKALADYSLMQCDGGCGTTNAVLAFYNNVFIGSGLNNYTDMISFAYAFPVYYYNNTFNGNSAGHVITVNSQTILKNNICVGQGAGRNCYNGTAGTGSDYNTSSDASATGAHSYTSVTPSFVSIGTDYHLQSTDTVALGKGMTLSGDATVPFSTDILGLTRSVPWDIGAFKYVTAAPPVYTRLGAGKFNLMKVQ